MLKDIERGIRFLFSRFALRNRSHGGTYLPQGTIPIRKIDIKTATPVDDYWNEHTVNSKPFSSADESERYLEWRASVYPKFKEFMQLYGDHDGEVILDYGCGPGNDLVGFAIYTRARKIVGMDVSQKALNLANHRLSLHNVDSDRIQLILASDSLSLIPLEDASVDYINCAGVLHHTGNPQILIQEFHRVLRPRSLACVMVYNRDSLWFHLYAAYVKVIVEETFGGLNIEEVFSKTTDGVDCPIARCYRSEEFISMCEAAGFQCEYVGGYLSDTELESYRKYGKAALRDKRLPSEHKQFIASLTFDSEELPKHNGLHAGIGGVYRLFK